MARNASTTPAAQITPSIAPSSPLATASLAEQQERRRELSPSDVSSGLHGIFAEMIVFMREEREHMEQKMEKQHAEMQSLRLEQQGEMQSLRQSAEGQMDSMRLDGSGNVNQPRRRCLSTDIAIANSSRCKLGLRDCTVQSCSPMTSGTQSRTSLRMGAMA